MFEISKINKILNGVLYGDNKLNIQGPCSIKHGKKNHLAYIKNNKYLKYLITTNASAILVPKKIVIPKDLNKTVIKVENPSLSFIEFLEFFNNAKTTKKLGISSSSIIDKSTKIGKDIFIGDNVIIGEKCKIGNNVQIYSNSIIENNCNIKSNSIVKSNVVIKNNTQVGENCIIKSGAIIGDSGFGLVTENGVHHNIPHIGQVIINDNVLIGSNCTIDRSTLDNTIIGKGTKLDNLVQIGHNVKIGENCIICAQVGIGGSTKIGNNVIIGGQTGIIDHIKIENNAIVGPKSFIIKSIKSNSYVSGNPGRNHRDRVKQDILIQRLPDIYKKITK